MNYEIDRRHRRRAQRCSGGEMSEGLDRWLISYADLVTLLFALFVVLYAAADRERAQRVAQAIAWQFGESKSSMLATTPGGSGVLPAADSLAKTHAAIERAFAANQMLSARARITNSERGLVVSLAEAGFFAPGEAAVRDDALALVDALADALHDSNMPLRVEGHTDSTPISSTRYPSNWELSAARASSVLARLVARGLPPARLSVAGYAAERPVADNATPEGRALNRRVDLVIQRMSTQE